MTKRQRLNKIKSEHRAFDPARNPRNRGDFLDYDYLDKLSPSDLEYLAKFTEEYSNAALNAENPETNLHQTPEERSICWGNNNRRNRDLYAFKKQANLLIIMSALSKNKESTVLDPEQVILAREEEDAAKFMRKVIRKAVRVMKK